MVRKKDSTHLAGIRKGAHKGVDTILDKAESIEERGKETVIKLEKKASTMREGVDDYIRKNPEQSVLIAAGVGAVVGALIVATMMRRKN